MNIFAAMAATGTDIHKACNLLMEGRLVAIPTETVYGLAGDALNERAILKIFETKNRPSFDPLIIHVHAASAALNYTGTPEPPLAALMDACWPGPLTVLLRKKPAISPLVTSGSDLVAVRVPDHPLALDLLKEFGRPLAAPSANPFGYISPTRPEHVQKQLGDRIDYILDGGPCRLGLESTIVGFEDGHVVVHRVGALPVETITQIAGSTILRLNQSGNPLAPGQLKSHYAPLKKLQLVNDLLKVPEQTLNRASVICFGMQPATQAVHTYNLSAASDLNEAALHLFHFLRLADEDDSDSVLAMPVPDHGIGRAINDRLRRAAARG
jgi:L-threonylcarbamoyladenylate synthase